MLKSLLLKFQLKTHPSETGGISGFILSKQEPDPGNVLITDNLDKNAEEVLRKGGSVLLLTYGRVGKGKWSTGGNRFLTVSSGILHGQIISLLIHWVYYAIRKIRFSMIFLQNITVTGSGGIRFHIPRQ